MNAIEVRDVHKAYRRYGRRRQFGTLKSALLGGRLLRDLRPDETFEAIKGVSFDVPAGRTFGIVGRNGSGKSTMLKLIAGIGRPTAGTVTVRGRVSALIELGAGFHPEISGRENVFINGMMLGLTRREIAARFDAIVAFAELEEFIDAPVKTYSSGMYMRLGFAVAIHVDPDVLLIDEVLAVGDEAFTHKCLDKFAEFRRKGRTVLLVTHSLDLVTRFCDEALWLDAGLVRIQGDPRRVVDAYLQDVAKAENAALGRAAAGAVQAAAAAAPVEGRTAEVPVEPPAPANISGSAAADEPPDMFKAEEGRPSTSSGRPEEPPDMFRAIEGRWGSREVEITAVEVLGRDGLPTYVFESGDPLEIRLRVEAPHRVTDVVFGVGIFNAEGVCCYGTNTKIEGAASGELIGAGDVRFAIDRLELVEGTYKLDVAAHRENGAAYDYHRLLYTIRVTSRLREAGIYRPPHRWTFSGGVRITGLSS
ncbi:MAG: ABC transporter ATP-binding protein [Acidobacteria bacterium]|nr:ABC transporter ATP-binding protein [Acidobacteriota bacterium]